MFLKEQPRYIKKAQLPRSCSTALANIFCFGVIAWRMTIGPLRDKYSSGVGLVHRNSAAALISGENGYWSFSRSIAFHYGWCGQ